MVKFHEYESAGGREFELDPFQQEAVDAIDAGHSVLVAAPTGAGKTVIAEYAVELALKRGERVIYTAPIKALSNQKFRDFRSRFGDRVGIMTGDVTINGTAPALIMTTEIFRNALFAESGRFDDTKFLIFDEVHYINDLERGTVWEESIIFAPAGIQFVCLSATMPNVDELAAWISEVRSSPKPASFERGWSDQSERSSSTNRRRAYHWLRWSIGGGGRSWTSRAALPWSSPITRCVNRPGRLSGRRSTSCCVSKSHFSKASAAGS
jgi:replicative superfamily II helicase